MSCFHKLPSAIKAHDNVQELYPLIEKRLESVETVLVNKLISFNDKSLRASKTYLLKKY